MLLAATQLHTNDGLSPASLHQLLLYLSGVGFRNALMNLSNAKILSDKHCALLLKQHVAFRAFVEMCAAKRLVHILVFP